MCSSAAGGVDQLVVGTGCRRCRSVSGEYRLPNVSADELVGGWQRLEVTHTHTHTHRPPTSHAQAVRLLKFYALPTRYSGCHGAGGRRVNGRKAFGRANGLRASGRTGGKAEEREGGRRRRVGSLLCLVYINGSRHRMTGGWA